MDVVGLDPGFDIGCPQFLPTHEKEAFEFPERSVMVLSSSRKVGSVAFKADASCCTGTEVVGSRKFPDPWA